MTFKKCNCCGEIKPIDEFRHGTCKKCENEKNKIRYKEKQYYKQYQDEMNRYFVYRLIKNEEIIYVGRTKSFVKRMQSHKLNKEFDRVEILTFDNPIDMQISELYFISKYKPILNNKDKHNKNSLSLYELDILDWIEIDLTSVIQAKKIPVDLVSNINANDGTIIQLKDIKSVFTRKRNENYLVYVELDNKKQKLIKSFKNKTFADNLTCKIKKSRKQEQIQVKKISA